MTVHAYAYHCACLENLIRHERSQVAGVIVVICPIPVCRGRIDVEYIPGFERTPSRPVPRDVQQTDDATGMSVVEDMAGYINHLGAGKALVLSKPFVWIYMDFPYHPTRPCSLVGS